MKKMQRTINCNGKLLSLEKPLIMGILNVTPDSFYDGGKYTQPEQIYQRVKKLIDEGADIIDVGAASSRPGADEVPQNTEIKRLTMALEIIRNNYPDICISIDTYRSEVARFAVENFKANIINDIMGGSADENMFKTIADLQVPYILMHIKGTPKTMQNNPHYENIIQEIIYYFSERIKKLRLLGVNDIIIDPGFGFGKTLEHNYIILKNLEHFRIFELPVLVGISRKSMIYKYLNITPQEALPGTIALNMIALLNGANILRVHDVAEAKQIVELFEMYKKV